jgi:hypothetical protein
MHAVRYLALIVSTTVILFAPSNLAAQSDAPGLGPAGKLLSISFEQTGGETLLGRDARQQLIVTGKYSSGQSRDLTRNVTWTFSEPGVVDVSEDGFVTPAADGDVTVTATSGGISGEQAVSVRQLDRELLINFPNQIVPIFTKLGCNTGSCHGKSGGQNGFRLSLLGFYPHDDYESLVKEANGRRLFPSSPQYSLLLLKASNQLAHGGGRRLALDSYEGQILTRWIEQGMPLGSEDDPVVERIEVFPKTRAMNRGSDQQLAVVGHYTDGTTRDLTRMVGYESNDLEVCEVTPSGIVRTQDTPGAGAVMIRFQGHVTVFQGSIPLGLEVTPPESNNFVDDHVFAKLTALGIPPSPVCDDATFIRRTSIDITGRLPTPADSRKFIAATDPQKRAKLVSSLLETPGYGDYFANKWNAVLRNKTSFEFHGWIRRALQQNMPYDEFVRNILVATGDASSHPPARWFQEVTTPLARAEDTAQLFLGLRVQCARCHHHPFERWSQNDYYGFTAFFAQTQTRNEVARGGLRIVHNDGIAQARNPRNQEDIRPTGLGGEALDIPAYEDPRHYLVDWMSAPDNPFFARALVNRYWKHFFGRGIVEPEDDMRVTNPPTNPALLDALAQSFIESGFDLKQLVASICSSNAYQLASEPNQWNQADKQNFSRYYAKRLTAEVLYDALNQVTNTSTGFTGMPTGTRAVQLPITNVNNYFLTVFGKPQAATACECERSADANLAQSLHLLNSPEVLGKLSAGGGRADLLAKSEELDDSQRIREIYEWVYSRGPTSSEIDFIQPRIAEIVDRKQAYEDLLWALINTKEFLFNH